MKPLTDALLVVRDALYEALIVRKGEVLTEEVCRERAANGCHYVIEALIDGIRAKLAVKGATEQEADETARAVPGQDVIGAIPQSTSIETTPAGRRYFEDDDTAIETVREPATKGERNA